MAMLSYGEKPYCSAVLTSKAQRCGKSVIGAEEKEDRFGYEMEMRVTDRGSITTVHHRCSIMIRTQALGIRESKGLAPL